MELQQPANLVVAKFLKNETSAASVEGEILVLPATQSNTCQADKSRKSNRKHGQSFKTGEKRSYKPEQTGLDCFGAKTGSINSNAGGNNILGIYGLKAESLNVMKYMADLRLEDLINGDCKVARYSPVETRESHNTNENVLQCVQKICQIRSSQSLTSKKNAKSLDIICNLKGKLSRSSTADKEKVGGEASSPRKEIHSSEPCEVDFEDAMKASPRPVFPVHKLPLYQPEEVLQRLKILPIESVDSLISQSPVQKTIGLQGSSFLNSNSCMVQNGSIPPFPWSLPYCGPCKSNLDTSRLSANRYKNGRQWIQIGATHLMNPYCSSNSQSTKCAGLKSESGNKFEGFLEAPTSIPFFQSFPFLATGIPAPKPVVEKDTRLQKDSSFIDSCDLSEVEKSVGNRFSVRHLYRKSEEPSECPDEHPKDNASCVEETLKSEKLEPCTSQFPSDCTAGVENAIFPAPEKSEMLYEEERTTVNSNAPCFSPIAYALRPSHDTLPFRDQDNAAVPVSPRAEAAAWTLYDIAHSIPYQKKDGQNTAKNKRQTLVSWHGALSQRATKVHKSINSMHKDSDFKCPKKVEMKEIKTRAGRDLMPQNKGPSFERRKSLNQVNDTSRIVKHSLSTTGKIPGGIMKASKRIDELGVSCDKIELMKGRIFHEQARENTGYLGEGLASLMTISSPEASLKTGSTETHARAFRRTVPPLAAQKRGMMGGLKFCGSHFSERGSRGASVRSDQLNVKSRSSQFMGSSSSIQNNASNTTKHRQSLSSQEGTKNRDLARERSSRL